MLKFYLRQTVPFNITDLPILFKCFFSRTKNIDRLVKKEIKKTTRIEYVVLADSMRSILYKSLEFFRIKNPKKTEILLPEYSFHSNLSSALKAGFDVKFIPIDKKTLLIDEKKLEQLITKRTLGIIITHVHGKIYDLKKIKDVTDKHNLIIFEDCAHSFPIEEFSPEKTKRTSPIIKCLSFGPGKFVTAFGGGGLVTNNKELSKFVESQLIKSEDLKKDLIILIKACLYTLISTPLISYFTMKPALALIYVLKNKKNEADSFDQSTARPTKIKTMGNFQKELLFLQLKILSLKLKKIVTKRQENAETWFKLFKGKKIDTEFCFQFPVIASDPEDFIWRMWQQNIDVQKDYCSYLPSLIKKSSFSKKDQAFFEKIIYLPTNQYLSNKKIKELKT